MQRFGVQRRTSRDDLPETVENRGVPQVFKIQCGFGKVTTRTVTTQNNHIFMSIYAVFKLECLKIKHKANHFALQAKLFIKANQMAYEELQKLRTA